MQNLKVSKQYNLAIGAEVDEFGNVVTATFDSPPVWSLTDETLGAVNAAADGMSAVLVPSGKLGVCQLQALALSGGKQLVGSAELTFVAGDAVGFVLSVTEGSDNPVQP